jgi:hypothetical protein
VVSVIIPTYRRPELVERAARSALGQTFRDIEVIVVVDGRDAESARAVEALNDARVVLHVPERRLGNADARNRAVSLSHARWIAFLDDDDEWLPAKLERQLESATSAGLDHPIVSCRLIARDENGDRFWPRRLPRDGEPLSEYFFCRRTPFTGEGMVINSAILTTRALMEAVPFRSGLQRHVDPDWMLRAARHPGARMIFAGAEPLVIWHVESTRARITTDRNWRESLAWCSANRDLFTARSYAAFVLHVAGSAAALQGESAAFRVLLDDAFRHGSPSFVDLVSHVGNFVIPRGMQRRIAGLYERLA